MFPLKIRRGFFLLGIILLLSGCSLGLNKQGPQFREILLQGEGREKILLVDIYGPISNTPLIVPNIGVVPGMTSRIRQELELAYRDPYIRGILLRINSPGGTLTDSDIIYHSLMEFKKSKRVKIVASLGELAASGGLYVAMAADEIYAHPTTLTGSIGVIIPHMEYSGLMKKLGVKSNPVTSGKFKDFASPYRERTPEEKQMIQKLVDHQFQKFIKVIADSRKKMTRKKVREIGDGRLFSAKEAKDHGLIDGIGYLDDTYRKLSTLSGATRNRLVRYSNVWLTGNNIYSSVFPIEGFPIK